MTYNFLKNAAVKFQGNPAIIDNDVVTTFSELYNSTEKIRIELFDFGLGTGDVVAIVCDNSRSFLECLFATSGCGSAVLPVYVSLGSSERQEIYKESNVRFIVGQSKYLSKEKEDYTNVEIVGNLLMIERSKDLQASTIHHVPTAAFIRFSSGTTGKSKGVILSHQSVLERTEAVYEALRLENVNVVLWVLPMAFHFIATIICFVRYGICLVNVRSFFATDIIAMANKTKADLLYVSPLHIKLLANDLGDDVFENPTKVISTSSGISQENCLQFYKRFNLPVHQAYGIIEVGLVLVNWQDDPELGNRIGKTSSHYEVAILDEAYNLVDKGEVGKLAMRGKGMFDAYMSPAAMRSEVLENNWFITGDLAVEHVDASFEIMGREKSMINVSGNKVFPEEVEQVLESITEIKEAYVKGVYHKITGEAVEASIVFHEGQSMDESEILNISRNFLTTYKLPKSIIIVKEIKRTKTGKKERK